MLNDWSYNKKDDTPRNTEKKMNQTINLKINLVNHFLCTILNDSIYNK